jgi:hypothetical protein
VAIAADTIIHTLRGDVPAGQLANTGEFLGFTWNGKQITVGRACFNPEPRRVPTMRLLLDDGKSLRATEDALVVQRDGVEGEPWMHGLSLMPLYLGKTTHGYPTYKQVGEGYRKAIAPCDRRRVRLVARMVYEWKTGMPIETGMIVRHKNGSRVDCYPENLHLEGKPNPKRRTKFVRLKEAQQLKVPNNHRVAGFTAFGDDDDVLDFAEGSCENIAASGIFVVSHHAPAS